jgi:hypothetical protein
MRLAEILADPVASFVAAVLLTPLLLLCAVSSEWRLWRTGSRYTVAERDYIARWSS